MSTRVLRSVLTVKIIVLTAMVQKGAEIWVQVANMVPSGRGARAECLLATCLGVARVHHRERGEDQLEVKQEQSEN